MPQIGIPCSRAAILVIGYPMTAFFLQRLLGKGTSDLVFALPHFVLLRSQTDDFGRALSHESRGLVSVSATIRVTLAFSSRRSRLSLQKPARVSSARL